MQFVNLLLVVLLSMILSTFAFDVARKPNPETSVVEEPEISELPEIPEFQEVDEEGPENSEGINQMTSKAEYHKFEVG